MDEKHLMLHHSIAKVRKVEVITVENGVETKRVLSGDELEQWKREHGYVDTENETKSDTDRQTDSDTRESE